MKRNTIFWMVFVVYCTALSLTSRAEPADVCAHLEGKLFGLCNAYCEAIDCDGSPKASSRACASVKENFARLSDGQALPCERVQPPPVDTDGDGIPDAEDNCVITANANQIDSDGDGIGDACDNCASGSNPSQADSDLDGIGDFCDNCPSDSNPDQLDIDPINGIGDACEPVACFPDCAGKACGSDDCGGSCGSCGTGQICTTDFNCVDETTPEICDGIDNDGDGSIDEGVVEPSDPCEVKNDNGVCTGAWQCEGLGSWVCNAQPATPEGCPSLCVGVIYYADSDGDGFGDPGNTLTLDSCAPPAGYVVNSGDCDDGDASKNLDCASQEPLCSEECGFSSDGQCDDGGPSSDFGICELGTDCSDCGARCPEGTTLYQGFCLNLSQ